MKKVLYPRDGVAGLKPLEVDTIGKDADGASIETCLGIGELRKEGYDVGDIPAVVHKIGEVSDATG